jgi:rod shape-determining protein MreC
VIRLSVPTRHALSRLTLPVLIVTAFCLLLLGKADALLATQLRMALGDSLAPIYAAVAAPVEFTRDWLAEGGRMLTVMHDNTLLREENEKLRKWQTVALALDAENATLKANLHWLPDSAPSFVTARVVADTGGIYARSVLVSTGPTHFVSKGQIALDDQGLVGRVTEVGERSARILLITDLNSRVPVMLSSTRTHAIMAGTNTDRPRLMFLPQDAKPIEGERVVTTGEASVYPADLPVGSVHYASNGAIEIIPEAQLNRLDIVRLFDYGLRGLVPPEAPMQKQTAAALQALPPAPEYWHTAPDRAVDNRQAYVAALKAHQQAVQQAADAARAAAIRAATASPGAPVGPDATPD